MSELGLRLKNAREERKLTLDQLQKITKIQKRYLQAIEEGNLAMLPGQFYARAFVKSYAEAVGIDPDLLFDEFANELPAFNKYVSEIPPRMETRKKAGTKQTQKLLALLPTVVAVVFISALLIGAWYFFQDNSAVDQAIPKEKVQSPVEGGRDEAALKLAGEANKEAKEETKEKIKKEDKSKDVVEEVPKQEFVFLETKGKETSYQLVNAPEFSIKIDLQGRCYIGIDNNKGKFFFADNVENGKSLTFDFSEEETIRFNFGASNNVKLYINDELFKFPQDIAHQKVTFHYQKATLQ